MKHISLPLLDQIQYLHALESVNVRQFADGSQNFIVTPLPGRQLFVGDIMCSLQINELAVYDDGIVVTAYMRNGSPTIQRSNIKDYGTSDEGQLAWISSK